MDRLIVERKLDSLRHCLERIASKRPASVAALERDADLQDVLTLNLSRAVQICVDIGVSAPETVTVPGGYVLISGHSSQRLNRTRTSAPEAAAFRAMPSGAVVPVATCPFAAAWTTSPAATAPEAVRCWTPPA